MVLKKLGKTTLLFILPALLMTGCSSDKDSVATMNGYSLSSETFLNELNLSRTAYEMSSSEELSDEYLKQMATTTIQHLTLLEAFCKEGEKLNLNPSDEELEELFNTTKEQSTSIAGVQAILDSANYTDELLKEYLYKNETAYNYYLYLYDSISTSGADAKKFFEDNKDKLYTIESADADHILFKTYIENEDGSATEMPDEEKAAVKKKAEEVLKQVESGEDFNELAKKHSEDEGSKEDGGKLGEFSRGQMVQPFEDAAFALEEGKTSKLVETIYGYHIIKLNKKNLTTYNYDDISTYVRQDLLDSIFIEKVEEIQRKYNIKTNTDKLTQLLDNLEPITVPSDDSSDEDNTSNNKKDSNTKEKSETKEDSSKEEN